MGMTHENEVLPGQAASWPIAWWTRLTDPWLASQEQHFVKLWNLMEQLLYAMLSAYRRESSLYVWQTRPGFQL